MFTVGIDDCVCVIRYLFIFLVIIYSRILFKKNWFFCPDISEETQARVNELLDRNKQLVGQETEADDEIPPLYLNEPEYLIWEYNPNNPDYIPGRYPERVPEV